MSRNRSPQQQARRKKALITAGILFGVVTLIYLAFVARGVLGA